MINRIKQKKSLFNDFVLNVLNRSANNKEPELFTKSGFFIKFCCHQINYTLKLLRYFANSTLRVSLITFTFI